jgi:hypothetical protein
MRHEAWKNIFFLVGVRTLFPIVVDLRWRHSSSPMRLLSLSSHGMGIFGFGSPQLQLIQLLRTEYENWS